jgi:hypothetical protein
MALEWLQLADRFEGDAEDRGMLRDILILDTDLGDWQQIFDVIHRSPIWRVRYSEDGKELPLPTDAELAFRRAQDAAVYVELRPGGMYVRGYVWDPERVEFDVDPDHVNSQVRLDHLVDLMTKFGRATGKPVYVTPESVPTQPLITYDPASDQVRTN